MSCIFIVFCDSLFLSFHRLAISTPSPEGNMNFYTTMMDSKDPNTGKPMFKVLKVGLACDACQAAGIASECTHMESFRPPWKSASKFAMVKQIYSTQKGMFERESMGLNTEDADVVFPAKVVASFLRRTADVHPESRVLLVAMDPSGGGDSSMSLVTVSLMTNYITVVAFDEQPIKGVAEMESMIMRHVQVLRREYPAHWLVFALESNLGQEAAHASAMLERNRVAKHVVIQEKDRVGVLTTAPRKELYADNLRFYLEQNSIGLRKGGVLTGNPAKGEAARVQQTLHEQLTNYRRVNVDAGPGKLAKRHFSGKIAGSRQDDLVLTLQLSCYWMVRLSSRSIPGMNFDKFQ